jgi:hypothetical protein
LREKVKEEEWKAFEKPENNSFYSNSRVSEFFVLTFGCFSVSVISKFEVFLDHFISRAEQKWGMGNLSFCAVLLELIDKPLFLIIRASLMSIATQPLAPARH